MLYPQLCKLVLQLLLDHPVEDLTSGVLSHVLQKLISLCKPGAEMASVMYQQDLVQVLLTGLRKIIKKHGSSGEREQRLILNLFLLLAQQGFTSRELKLFLSLYQEENAPVVGGFLFLCQQGTCQNIPPSTDVDF